MKNSKLIYAQRRDFGLPSTPVTKFLKVNKQDFNKKYDTTDDVDLSDKRYLRKADTERLANELLTIEATDGSTDMYVIKQENGYAAGEAPNVQVRYFNITTNEWSEWQNLGSGEHFSNSNKIQLKGDNPNGFSLSNAKNTNLYFSYTNKTTAVKISGSIMSLLGEYVRDIPNNFCFAGLFWANIATSTNSYQTLDLSELQLPTKTVEGCYYRFLMGGSHTTISKLPDISHITNVARSSFNSFYTECKMDGNKIVFPNVSKFGYAACNGYAQASDITEITVPNVEMDYATFNNCCQLCKSLTKATLLPKHSTERCYYNLFKGCTSLTEVTMYLEDVEATDCLKDMLSGVTTTGTLYVLPTMVENEYILSILPATWTIKAIEEE